MIVAAVYDRRKRSGAHRAPLQRGHARVVVEFDLPPADAAHDEPAVLGCELSQLLIVHLAQDPQLGRMGDENLRLNGKRRSDLRGERG
jgi:hypothetical protein